MEELIKKVQEWANDKGLNKPEQAKTQFLKVLSEYGETCDAIIKRDKNGDADIIDGFGDIIVTLIVLSKMQGVNFIAEDYNGKFIASYKPFFGDLLFTLLGLKKALDTVNDENIMINIANVSNQIYAFCNSFGFTPEQCLRAAYDEIKGRTGKLVNGTFIKDEVKEMPQVVDLSELKEGDSVEFKNGELDKIERVQKCDADWDYKVYFSDGTVCMYMQDGRVLRSEEPRRAAWNIIRIIKA